jgi:uncharacterized membrane protein required for colicin V production
MSVTWPDIIIAAILAIATIKGFKRGFVSELSGAIALVLALITPWYYNGAFDPFLEKTVHLSPGSAHVVGMFATGFATYAAVLLIAWALNAVAKLPVLGFGNALFGAAVGFIKGAVLVWLILYVVLFFPLSRDLRTDLHHSTLVGYATQPNAHIDGAINGALPWFARPFAHPFFARHRV